ncbi:MAG: VOC family protein [Actinomycetales bacterium]|nr:VOC family protein [Actinomycetales bacterium]
MTVRQLRLVLEVDDLDAALDFYRDALGLPELASYQADGGARVAILEVPSATLELANAAQVDHIDAVEVGRPAARAFPARLRVAFEVDEGEAAAATSRLVAAGAEQVAPPTETPWRSRNSRLDAPGGLQLTIFEELEGSEERALREGFGTSDDR